jgi:hypothetical protein
VQAWLREARHGEKPMKFLIEKLSDLKALYIEQLRLLLSAEDQTLHPLRKLSGALCRSHPASQN